MSTSDRDSADRYLDLIVRLLPAARSDWCRALRAELATIDKPSERRRFALSCTRVALLPTARTGAIARPLAVAGTVGLVLGGELAGARVIGQTVPLALALTLLAWLGRRPGFFGPVRPDRPARATRAGGYALVGSCLIAVVVADGPSGLLRPDSLGWSPAFALALTLLAAVFLATTARASRFAGAGLAAGAGAGLVAGLAAFAVLPFERIGPPLAAGLPGRGAWLALIVFAAPAAAAALTGRRTRRADQAVMAALCAGAFTAVLVALLGLIAIVLFPDRVPDIVGPVMIPGTPAAQRQLANASEASDPYFGLLLLGALLCAILWVMARPPSRAGATVALLFLLGVPPVALCASATNFPGSVAITFATLAVVIGAVVTTRPRPARGVSDGTETALV